MRKWIVVGVVVALLAIMGAGASAFMRMRAAGNAPKADPNQAKVARNDLVLEVVANGTVDAVQAVEVKSRATGRLARLLTDEGDYVEKGQLLAIIDPQETRLRVQQDMAQLRGAMASVSRSALEIQQRRATVQASYEQARLRVDQLQMELKAQPALTQAAIRQAELALATAREDRERLTAATHPNQLADSQRALDEAIANEANARSEFARREALEKEGFVAGREVESAKLNLDLAQVRLRNARESLSLLQRQQANDILKSDNAVRDAEVALRRARVNSFQDESKRKEYASALADLEKARAALSDPSILTAQKQQSQASVDQLRSVLSDSQRQLGETEIRAPFAGIVTRRTVEVGDLVTGLSQFGQGTAIVRLEDRSRMRVKLEVNEIDVAKMQVGMPARIDVDALPERTYRGRVSKISPASSVAAPGQAGDVVVKYAVEIELVDKDARLRSGMTARCSVEVVKKENVLTIPLEFIVRDGRKRFVEVPDGPAQPGMPPKTKRVEVQTGTESGARIEILSGLEEGAVVVRPKFSGPRRQGFMQAGGPDE